MSLSQQRRLFYVVLSCRLLSRACGDFILPLVIPFITNSLTGSNHVESAVDDQQKAAALAVLAAVMEGPTALVLLPLVHGLIDLLETLLVSQASRLVSTVPNR